jgi:predicted O-methyltransferase YrrM
MTSPALFAWIDAAVHQRDRADPFGWIRDATDTHRHQHGCWAYPYQDGSILGAIAAVLAPSQVLELGTALGYTACWWARDGARVDTIERDPLHIRQARTHLGQAHPAGAVTVHEGDFDAVFPTLEPTYDLAFFDGYEPPAGLLDSLEPRLGAGAALITTNLDLDSGQFRSMLSALPGWDTHFIEDLAISLRV